MNGLILLLLAIVPHETTVTEHVDLVELNHFYADDGRHVFDQVIFYRWCEQDCRYTVLAWRMVKTPQQLPRKDWDTGKHTAMWPEQDGFVYLSRALVGRPDSPGVAVLRDVRADAYRESWTQYDPELLEREVLPKEKRRGLREFSKRLQN